MQTRTSKLSLKSEPPLSIHTVVDAGLRSNGSPFTRNYAGCSFDNRIGAYYLNGVYSLAVWGSF